MIFALLLASVAVFTSCTSTEDVDRSYRSEQLIGVWNVVENRTCITDTAYNVSLNYTDTVTQDMMNPAYINVKNFSNAASFTAHIYIDNNGSFSLDAGTYMAHGNVHNVDASNSTKVLNDNNTCYELNYTMNTGGYYFTSYIFATKQ